LGYLANQCEHSVHKLTDTNNIEVKIVSKILETWICQSIKNKVDDKEINFFPEQRIAYSSHISLEVVAETLFSWCSNLILTFFTSDSSL